MLFGDAHAGMAEQDRNLIDGNAGQQHFDGEGVTEHVAVATLGCAVRLAEIGNAEETTIGALPVGDISLGQTVAGPEEKAIPRYKFATGFSAFPTRI